ncbi:MAG: regulator of chromosome condensation [Myxococcaceae bacterium]|nr:regulator of chromosome condensation [Myxococcaceae bacterium]
MSDAGKRRCAGAALVWVLAAWSTIGGSLGACASDEPSPDLIDAGSPIDATRDETEAVRRDAVTMIAAGGFHTCAIVAGAAKCWGGNGSGQLGIGKLSEREPAPTPVAGLPAPLAIVAGYIHTCALTSGGRASCWGSNAVGQLAYDPASPSTDCAGPPCKSSPVSVDGVTNVSDLSLGFATSYALVQGVVNAWGNSGYGELGPARDGGPTFSPGVVPFVGAVSEVHAGGFFACARMAADGSVWCWGNNGEGELGPEASDGGVSIAPHPTPVQIPGLVGSLALAVGIEHACAVRGDKSVVCWGSNAYAPGQPGGQLGHAPSMDPACQSASPCNPLPTPVAGITSARSLALGNFHSCAVLDDDTVQCWGTKINGALGHDPETDSSQAVASPKPVTGLTNVARISAGHYHTCALTRDEQVLCWGDNGYGQLGNATPTTYSFSPLPVSGL